MNKLIITAHPNPHGFTHKIAAEFKKNTEPKHEVKIIDLYDDQRKQDFLYLNETNRPEYDDITPLMHEMITRTDEIIFIFPMRWLDAPAILKNWFDRNMSHGFAFKYTSKILPKRLLKGKAARLFITTGSPKRVAYTLGLPCYIAWRIGRLRYTGISLKSYTVFSNMNKLRYPEDRAKMLFKVASIAKKS